MKVFRKGGLILLLILSLLMGAVLYFVTDSFVEEQLEYALSTTNGAMVEFDGFSVSFFGGKVGWNKFQMTDPENLMKNSFETGKTSVSISAWKLLQKKVIIQEISLSEIKTGSQRTKSGALPKEWISEIEKNEESVALKLANEKTNEAKERISNEIKAQPIFQLVNTSINTDSIMALLKLESPQKMDSLKTAIQTNVNSVTQSIDELKVSESIKTGQELLNGIDIKGIKDVKSAEAALKSIDELKKSTESLKSRVSTAKNEVTSSVKSLKSDATEVDNWIADDYKRAREAAKLPDFDSQKMGELLLGEDVMTSFNEYLGYAKTARAYLAYIKTDKEKEVKPERLKGQDVRFKSTSPNPSVWIKKVHLDYITESNMRFTGLVENLVDNQKEINKPSTFNLVGKNAENEELKILGEFNYLGNQTKESFQFVMDKLSLRTLALGGKGSLPSGFQKGNGALKADIQIIDGNPNAHFSMINTDVVFKFDKAAKGKTETAFRTIMGNINSFNVTGKAESTKSGLKISIDSDIDNQVSRQIKALAQAEVDKVKKQIQAKVDEQVNAKKKELEQFVQTQEAKIKQKQAELEDKVNEQLQAVEKKKKELETKKDELIKQATSKVKDAIKSKIKF